MSVAGLKKQFYKASQVRHREPAAPRGPGAGGTPTFPYQRPPLRLGDPPPAAACPVRPGGAPMPAVIPARYPCPVAPPQRPVFHPPLSPFRTSLPAPASPRAPQHPHRSPSRGSWPSRGSVPSPRRRGGAGPTPPPSPRMLPKPSGKPWGVPGVQLWGKGGSRGAGPVPPDPGVGGHRYPLRTGGSRGLGAGCTPGPGRCHSGGCTAHLPQNWGSPRPALAVKHLSS